MSFQTPILFLVFNRPDTTKRVFEKIREQQPSRLYIAADGARTNNSNDALKCNEVLSIVKNIDWACEVKTLFRNQNLGCKLAVSKAITWFFDQEEMGIILEDDCLPNNSFFPYCAELLERYKTDEKIAGISGSNLLHYKPEDGASYFFSKYLVIWGWATWRRTWQAYDLEMKKWPEIKAGSLLKSISDGNPYFENHWKQTLDIAYNGEINTWDYQFLFSYIIKNQLSCIPANNMVSNIGFNEEATHTTNEEVMHSNLQTFEMPFPLKHPSKPTRAIIYDRGLDRKVFKITLKNFLLGTYGRLKRKLK